MIVVQEIFKMKWAKNIITIKKLNIKLLNTNTNFRNLELSELSLKKWFSNNSLIIKYTIYGNCLKLI